MTRSSLPGEAPRTAVHGDPIATARRSLVSVTAGVSGGTGWVALGNGLVVTSQRAVGCHADVTLSLEDGRRSAGRVVGVDVERDLAFVFPLEPFGVPALPLRPEPPPRLGEQTFVLIAPPGEAIALAPSLVAAEARGGEPAALGADVAPRAGHGGCPVLDAGGRVIGALTTGRAAAGARVGGDRHRVLLPVGLFTRDLRALDVPGTELEGRALILRCPSCTEPFSAENERCHACGRLLPHAFETPLHLVGAERVVRDALAALGVVANKVRVGPRVWRIFHRALGGEAAPSEVTVRIDELGLQVILRVPLVRLPPAEHEHFYRMLLTVNDQTAGVCRLSLAQGIVVLSFGEPVPAFASEHDVAVVFHDLVRLAEQYRKALAELFGAEALREGLREE